MNEGANTVYLKGHPYSNYHPLPGNSMLTQPNRQIEEVFAEDYMAQSQTDLYEKTHIVAKPYKGTPQYAVSTNP